MNSETKSSKSSLPSSLGATLRNLSPSERGTFLRELPREQQLAILYDWQGTWARPEQSLTQAGLARCDSLIAAIGGEKLGKPLS